MKITEKGASLWRTFHAEEKPGEYVLSPIRPSGFASLYYRLEGELISKAELVANLPHHTWGPKGKTVKDFEGNIKTTIENHAKGKKQ